MAKPKASDSSFVTLILDDTIPETLEGVQNRIVSIAEDFKHHEEALTKWYDETCAKLFQARDVLRLKEDPAGVLAEKEAEIAKLRAELEEARAGKGKGSAASAGPADDGDQQAWYEAMVKMGKGFHAQAEVGKALGGGWNRERWTPVVKRLVERGFIRKEQGVKGPAPKIEVLDMKKKYESEPQQTLAA